MKVLLKLFLIHGTRKAANTETGQAIGSGFLSFLPDLIFLAVVAAIVFGVCYWTESDAVKKLKTSESEKIKESMGCGNGVGVDPCPANLGVGALS